MPKKAEKKGASRSTPSAPAPASGPGIIVAPSAAKDFRERAKARCKERFGDERDDISQAASELDSTFRYLMVPDLMHQWALGRIGYVLGRIKVSVGMEGASKSSDLYYDCGLAQAQGGLAGVVAVEEADSTEHIKHYVPYPEDLVIWKARSLEEGMQMTFEMQKLFHEIDPEGKLPKVQGFDSIAGATEQDQELALEEDDDNEDDPDPNKQRPGGIGKIMKSFFNTMKGSIVRTNTLWHVVNQAREHIYTGFGADLQMKKALRERLAITGGKAQRFMASYFEFLYRTGAVKEAGDNDDDAKISTGFNVVVDWLKNKPRYPDRKITRRVQWGRNFDYAPHTMPALASSKILGVMCEKKRYWCDAIGISFEQKMRDVDIYPIIHSPEHIWKFQEALDILGFQKPIDLQTPTTPAAPTPPPANPSAGAGGGGLPPPSPASTSHV